ncbi:MAG: hypothetical protein U0176_10800 [Bacteroidia bacterium]
MNSNAMNVTVFGNFDVVSQNTFTGFQHTGRWYNYMSGDSLEVTDVNMNMLLSGRFPHLHRCPAAQARSFSDSASGRHSRAGAIEPGGFRIPEPKRGRDLFRIWHGPTGGCDLGIAGYASGRVVFTEVRKATALPVSKTSPGIRRDAQDARLQPGLISTAFKPGAGWQVARWWCRIERGVTGDSAD